MQGIGKSLSIGQQQLVEIVEPTSIPANVGRPGMR
jgi:hypothetical protein